ncbi:MAG: 3-oxoacyl-[acyl-carrier-protein] reductase [Candidatus Tectomicrobia bacterium]|nr:3-oxoacyl-[acyl-carrier-protein] reductase [Candidatus Tectomicrobia bacterium]
MAGAERVAFITGASRGIGRAIAEALAGEVRAIGAVAREAPRLEQTCAALRAAGVEVLALPCDVADAVAVQAAVNQIIDAYGRLDILVNNAGATQDSLIARMRPEQWQRILEVNLTGAFNGIRAVTRQMMKQRGGCIVNLTSVVGVSGNPGQANYVAAKAGIIGLTKAAALELAPRNIRVNAVAPGYIQTDMTANLDAATREALLARIPLGCLGEPADVAACVKFLISEAARYITGQVLHVNGGMLMP